MTHKHNIQAENSAAKRFATCIGIFAVAFCSLAADAAPQDEQQFRPIDRDKMNALLPKEFAGGRAYTTALGMTVPRDDGTLSTLKLMYANRSGGVVAQLDVVHNTTPNDLWYTVRVALEGESREEKNGAAIELKLIGGYPARIVAIPMIKQTIVSIALENGILISAKFNENVDIQKAVDACSALDLAGFNSLR